MIADPRISQAYSCAHFMDFWKLQFHNMINCYLYLFLAWFFLCNYADWELY
jgi:hypothetical protein